VARAIVEEIQIIVTPKEMEQLSKSETVDSSAFESLLKGLYHLYKLTPDDYEIALKYFEDVLRHDSTNAEALAGIALVWAHKGQWGGEAPLIAAEKGRKAAEKALKEDPNLPMAHQAMAHIYTGYYWSWEEALQEFKKTIELNQNLSEPRLFYADLLVSLHQDQEALDQTKVALELDPLNPFAHCLRGWVLLATGRYEEAILSFNRSLDDSPGIALSHRCLWGIYHFKGNYDLAVKHASLFYKSQDLEETANDLVSRYGELGYYQTLRFAASHLAEIATKKYVSGMRIARLYTFAGDELQALNWLEKAYQEHYVSFFSLNVDPHWNSLHHQQRFLDLVAQMNLTL
jgi:tetratricopeptide (TPR) repeat protein